MIRGAFWIVLLAWLAGAVGCNNFFSTPTVPAPVAIPNIPLLITLVPSPTASPIPSAPPPNIPAEVEACRGGNRVVVLLLDPRLLNGIRAGLDQFSQEETNGH